MEFYKKQVFRVVHYLQAASKRNGWRSSAVSTAVNGCLRYAEAAPQKYWQTHQLLLQTLLNTILKMVWKDFGEQNFAQLSSTLLISSVLLADPFILVSKQYLGTSWSTLSKPLVKLKPENSYMTWAHLLATRHRALLWQGTEGKGSGFTTDLRDKAPGQQIPACSHRSPTITLAAQYCRHTHQESCPVSKSIQLLHYSFNPERTLHLTNSVYIKKKKNLYFHDYLLPLQEMRKPLSNSWSWFLTHRPSLQAML